MRIRQPGIVSRQAGPEHGQASAVVRLGLVEPAERVQKHGTVVPGDAGLFVGVAEDAAVGREPVLGDRQGRRRGLAGKDGLDQRLAGIGGGEAVGSLGALEVGDRALEQVPRHQRLALIEPDPAERDEALRRLGGRFAEQPAPQRERALGEGRGLPAAGRPCDGGWPAGRASRPGTRARPRARGRHGGCRWRAACRGVTASLRACSGSSASNTETRKPRARSARSASARATRACQSATASPPTRDRTTSAAAATPSRWRATKRRAR